MRDTALMIRNKILYFKEIYKFLSDYFFIRDISFRLFIKKVFMKILISIFSTEYTKYEKNVRKQNCLFQTDLKLWSRTFFHRSYIYFLSMKNIIRNKKPLSKKNSTKKMLRTNLVNCM